MTSADARCGMQEFPLENGEWAAFIGKLTGFDYEVESYTVEFADGEIWDSLRVRHGVYV